MKMLFVALMAILKFTSPAEAGFIQGSFQCYNGDRLAFSSGVFANTNGYGQHVSKLDRTDFDVNFANELMALEVFGPRYSGGIYLGYVNQYYADSGDRTLLVGGLNLKPTFLFVLKPQNGGMVLEIWKWESRPHYGHVVLPGDELVYKEFFNCKFL